MDRCFKAGQITARWQLPDDTEICGCNGICKGTIVAAITAGAHDLAAVKATTKASASCGSCAGFSHEDVRWIIKSSALKSIPAVMQGCGWTTSCGCVSCRPALNFYMIAE